MRARSARYHNAPGSFSASLARRRRDDCPCDRALEGVVESACGGEGQAHLQIPVGLS